ncbi:MAG: hypothetical protein LBI58_03890 [Tannerellaceae bacterium]|jgi:hypothetical protein|nr:hypothetical protein [Tannerellaceae bacterium]
MKIFWMLIISMGFPLFIAAQQYAEYNRKGDEAMRRLDYSDARLFYSEGMPYCDMYSIGKLTIIWMENEPIRASMYNLMNRCFGCLNVRATEKDTTAINLLVRYYTEGIGTTPSEEMAAYWTEQSDEINAPDIVAQAPPPAAIPVRTVRLFAGYTFSPLAPAGVTVGVTGRRWGGYLRFKTDMSFQSYEGEFTGREPSNIPEQTLLGSVGQKANTYVATGGLVAVYKPFYFSVGAGYWNKDIILKYEEVDDLGAGKGIYSWYKKADAPYRGIAAEVDAMLDLGGWYVTAGCNILSFKDDNKLSLKAYLNAGIGIFF